MLWKGAGLFSIGKGSTSRLGEDNPNHPAARVEMDFNLEGMKLSALFIN
jgi:hypothetical protein